MVGQNEKTLLERVLAYYKRGWCIFPIGFNRKPPKGFKWKPYQTKRPDESKLREWFADGKYKSLAVVCGAVSGGLAVLDLDSERRCEWWRNTHPKLADTLPTSRTKDGLHIFFRSEPFRKRNGDEVDLLCEGAYAVLPPSPEKEWIRPLDGELPLLDPFEWGLEQFGIKRPQTERKFPEETEDREESEDSEDAERHRSHRGVGGLSSDDEIKKEVKNAIEHTLPEKVGERNTAIFPFCQWLKAIPELKDLPAIQLKPIVKEWHKRAYDVIGTKPFVDTWADFVHGWKRVKWPKGDVMLDQAVKRALDTSVTIPQAEEYDTEEANLLVRICHELQQIMGDKPFFLASRTAGGILGVSHRTAYKLLEMLVADEILRLVEKHTPNRAPRYRYIGN